MVVVFLMEHEVSVGRKGQQTLGRFNVLYFRMVKLASELPILEYRGATDEKQQHQAEYADVPQRQAMADVVISQHLRFVFPQHKSYPAHGMQQLFLKVSVQLTTEAGDLDIDHVIERGITHHLLPDFPRQHLS